MSKQIKDVFEASLHIKITTQLATNINRYVVSWETRPGNAGAIGSPLLGIEMGVFTAADRNGFFDLFTVDVPEIHRLLLGYCDGKDKVFGISMKRDIISLFRSYTNGILRGLSTLGLAPSDIRSVISEMESVDANYRVASDPFNLFSTYLMYLIYNSSLPEKQKQDTLIKVILFLQYKFFTSLVSHRFPFKANEAVMQATYELLTNKYEIRKLSSWGQLMYNRAVEFSQKGSIHYNTIKNYDDDKKIIYLITDIQTRLRNSINTFTQAYHKTKEDMDSLGSYSHLGTDLEGDKTMMSVDNNLDLTIATIFNNAMVTTRFLDEQAILLASKLFAGVTVNKFRGLLIAFSEKAVVDAKSGKLDKVTEKDNKVVYVGARIIIQKIIQASYRHAINTKANLKDKVGLLKLFKDAYASSRISDEGILLVRDSCTNMVTELYSKSLKSATMIPTYRLAFIMYILLLSFRAGR